MNSIGERIQHLRKITRITRSYLREKYFLSENTLQKLENNLLKFTDDRIDFFHTIFRNEGIRNLTREWIKTGKGEEPVFSTHIIDKNNLQNDSDKSDDLIALEELSLIISLNPKKYVQIYLDSDYMMPYYHENSWLIGKKNENKTDCIGKDCIVKLNGVDGLTFRRVQYSEKKNKFNLYILNTFSSQHDPVILNCEVEFLAPIIWMRKLYV